MKSHSFGIIPVFRYKDSWQVLLIQHRNGGHWSFPKGGKEDLETPKQAALRELEEETGINNCIFLSETNVLEESYSFLKAGIAIEKTVTYFLAEVFSKKVDIQEEEILDFQWIDILKANLVLSFPEAKKICHEAIKILKDYDDDIRS